MKKILLLICLVMLSGCVKSGEFTEDRVRMHEMNRDKDICEKNPDRCISGISW